MKLDDDARGALHGLVGFVVFVLAVTAIAMALDMLYGWMGRRPRVLGCGRAGS